jgi:hypothetical protein
MSANRFDTALRGRLRSGWKRSGLKVDSGVARAACET